MPFVLFFKETLSIHQFSIRTEMYFEMVESNNKLEKSEMVKDV
jgi:hypothetical protein